MSDLARAIRFAVYQHGDQMSEDGTPYILHPLAVMAMGQDEEEQIVGVLHDTLEDTKITEGMLRGIFGHRIADAVIAMSRMDPSESYEDFIQRCKANDLARRVKVNDITHNLSRPPVKNPERQARLTKRYLAALVALREGDVEVGALRWFPGPSPDALIYDGLDR